MANLSDSEVADCKECFAVFDLKGTGKVDALKVGDMLRALKLKPTQKAVEKLLGGPVKKEGEKSLALDEFLPIYKEASKNKDTGAYEDFMEALKVYDKESNGTVLTAELRHLLLSLGEKLKDGEMDEIFKLCGNEDSEGYCKYEDFINKVLKGPFPDEQ